MRYTEIDRRIDLLAERQHGAFSRQQVFELGGSDRFIQRRLSAGDWARPEPAVYVLRRSPGSWLRQCKIAELSVTGAALGGRTAAAFHRLTGFRPGPIELVAPATASCRHTFAHVHRYAGARLTTVDGFRLTTIAQTLFDLAHRVSPWQLERALDEALLDRRLTVDELDERLTFYNGARRPGLPRIRPLVEERVADGWTPAESELEARLFALLDRLPDQPAIVRQAPLPWRGAQAGRVDALLPDHRLIIEADGRRWHSRVADFDADRWRDNRAVAHGHRVLRFTWLHLHRFADEVLDLIIQTTRHPAVAACPLRSTGEHPHH